MLLSNKGTNFYLPGEPGSFPSGSMAQRAAEPAAHFPVWTLNYFCFLGNWLSRKTRRKTGVWYWEGTSGNGLPETDARSCVFSLFVAPNSVQRRCASAGNTLRTELSSSASEATWLPSKGCVLLVFSTQNHLFPPSYQADGFSIL